ncbi:LOW QUALITY PROTEIN: hippocampus abundant transcript 1 protein-like [Amphiura filiformis]|uniref:LOW QUALITY PROTEIN: hippocampus abundant transcript 1 protein-like n=1 Tax=Amphiura filiformis TaxID=82378 RepID=UPI003B21C46C
MKSQHSGFSLYFCHSKSPLLGALSDVWGRKSFLLLTVFFTCMPIPLMRVSPCVASAVIAQKHRRRNWCGGFGNISTGWAGMGLFFAIVSVSGVFSVTFSIVFAYVADITSDAERSSAYGLVSATFAASLITSPALGIASGAIYGDNFVIFLATAVALCDVLFILVAVPESLPEKVRKASWGASISWEQADPFAALRKVGQDYTVLLLCIAVFLSYLPEAGQYSCMFLYLRMVGGFKANQIPAYIALVGVLSVFAQTLLLGTLTRNIGAKHTIMVGLTCEMLELMWYGFGSEHWMMWAAGVIASVCSINYPAMSALVSSSANADNQGVVQGMVTGIRGLCNGLGPALFGFIFYFFDVNLDLPDSEDVDEGGAAEMPNPMGARIIAGPPFVFGSFLIIIAQLVTYFIPNSHSETSKSTSSTTVAKTHLSPQMSPRSSEDFTPLLLDMDDMSKDVVVVDLQNP